MDTQNHKRLIVYGCGTLGTLTAAHFGLAGGTVVAFTRTETRHAALRAAGHHAQTGSPATTLVPEDTLLIAVPGAAALREALETLAPLPAPHRAVLISSTAYYGQVFGTVDEATPPGQDERAQDTANVEHHFRAWAGENGVILRTGGLYQRGRGPLSALRQSGRAPLGPPDRTLPLIHYEDAALAAYHALVHGQPEAVYVSVVTPCPTRRDFYDAATTILELPAATYDAPLKLQPAVYDNSRLRRDLLPVPRHPRWQECLVP